MGEKEAKLWEIGDKTSATKKKLTRVVGSEGEGERGGLCGTRLAIDAESEVFDT